MATHELGFRGQRWICSNFYPCDPPIIHNGLEYPTSEHLYKTLLFDDPQIRDEIRAAKEAKHAKFIGLKYNEHSLSIRYAETKPLFRYHLMAYVCACKFSNKDRQDKLYALRAQELTEYNYWHDNFYGHCLCKKCIPLEKKNYLGVILNTINHVIHDARRFGREIDLLDGCKHDDILTTISL